MLHFVPHNHNTEILHFYTLYLQPAPSSSAPGPGWVVSDRPRSATGAAAGSNTGGSRTATQAAGVSGTSNTNSLSYGNLKNRFLSGSGTHGKAQQGESTSSSTGYGAQIGVTSGTGVKGSTGTSKLFASLAR